MALYSIGPCFYHQSHRQPGIVFALAPSLHSFWSYFSTGVCSILGTYRPEEFLFQYPIILHFHTVHGVLKARILRWLAIPFSRECIRFIHLLWALPSHLSFISYFASVLFPWLFHISSQTCSGIPILNKYKLEFVSSLSSQSLYSFHYNISKNLKHYLSKCDYVCCAVLSHSVVSDSLWPHGL